MIELEEPDAATEAVKTRFSVDLTQSEEEGQAVMAHSAAVASKPVSGAHLELGHILAIDRQKWICVTLACNLVPGRAGGANRPNKGGDLKRFAALRQEYALDVQARLTGTQTRIGLDLRGISTEEPDAG